MKLTKMSSEVYEYVKDNGGRVSIDELVEHTGRNARSVGANVTDLTKKKLAFRDKVKVEGQEKEVVFVQLTPDHKAIMEAADEE